MATPLTLRQRDLIAGTWPIVKRDLDQHSMVFFLKIFELNPPSRGLFSFLRGIEGPLDDNEELQEHASKALLTAGEAAATLLEEGGFEKIQPSLIKLGKDHASYKVRPEHFPVVKEALIQTLIKGFGVLWTEELTEAWGATFDILSHEMVTGMNIALKK